MGSRKHARSGYAPRSPRYKLKQTLEDNKVREKEQARKPKTRWHKTVADALKDR
jgi:hypothetical protein